MARSSTPTRERRPITVDGQDETTDVQRLGDTKAVVKWGLAFRLCGRLDPVLSGVPARRASVRSGLSGPGHRAGWLRQPPKRIGMRWPGARLGHGLRLARLQRPGPLTALVSPVRQAFGAPFHPLWYRARPRQGGRGGVPWGHGSAPGWATGRASGAAARTRRRGGLRSSQTRSCRCRVPGETRPTPPSPASA
jgi:hypothetical protein